MAPRVITVLIALLVLFDSRNALVAQQTNSAKSKLNMVAAVHPLATDAGIKAFENGGNAIDAAIATALTLGVVDGYNSGIGGGCFILIRKADGQIIAIDGREMAPAAASRDMYLVNGKADNSLSTVGALASGVPGALAAYDRALRAHGKLALKQLILPAADIAEKGFPINWVYEKKLKTAKKYLSRFDSSKKVLLKPDGQIYRDGEVLIQKDLAQTYRAIAQHGIDWFYNGPFAKQTAAWMKQNGGIITEADMGNYRTALREPIRTTYRGYEIVGFPPPSSGGIHVAQILNMLESFDLAKIHESNPMQMKHIVVEAMKLAFADRAYWLGDSDYVKVPRGLIDKTYAAELAKKIDLKATSFVQSHGSPPDKDAKFFGKHTTHLCAADRQGNWVSITTTVNTGFGSKVIIPGFGVVMNNQMDDFSIAPGIPNAFGLIGAENNSIAPGKRPLSSMSPTIVLKNGQPVMTVGAAGGPKIITQVVWAIVNHIDLKMSVGEAIAAKRIHHQWSPDRLRVESSIAEDFKQAFRERGHVLKNSSEMGISQAISYDPKTRLFEGAFDPRIPGKAGGQTETRE